MSTSSTQEVKPAGSQKVVNRLHRYVVPITRFRQTTHADSADSSKPATNPISQSIVAVNHSKCTATSSEALAGSLRGCVMVHSRYVSRINSLKHYTLHAKLTTHMWGRRKGRPMLSSSTMPTAHQALSSPSYNISTVTSIRPRNAKSRVATTARMTTSYSFTPTSNAWPSDSCFPT